MGEEGERDYKTAYVCASKCVCWVEKKEKGREEEREKLS